MNNQTTTLGMFALKTAYPGQLDSLKASHQRNMSAEDGKPADQAAKARLNDKAV